MRQRGFTLLELLVAIAVFAVVALAAYAGWQQVNIVRERAAEQAKRLDDLQRAFYWLSEDFTQAINRPSRDPLGQPMRAMEVSQIGENLIEFTRTGWTNPAEGISPPRSHLQRVAYQFQDNKLYRRYWYHVDRYADDGDRRRLLVDNVDEVSFRFLDAGGSWSDSWPPVSANPDEATPLPRAVEITLRLPDYGELQRLFGLPG
jgi:general secretion pathway protein J